MNKHGFTTQILHSDRRNPIEHGSLHKPTHTAITYVHNSAQEIAEVFQGKRAGYTYGRQVNPTTTALEDKITQMEDGYQTACFSSGMAAISAITISLLRAGDHFISSQHLFGNTNSYFNTLIQLGIDVTFVDATDHRNIESAIKPNTKAVFVETIANPCTQVADLTALGELCEQYKLLYIVDNTMTTPYLFRPKSVKAGLIINSLSKSIGGHGDALGGAITDTGLYDWTQYSNIYDNYKGSDNKRWGIQQIKKKGLRDTGGTISPDSSHRIAIGAETLELRLSRASQNSQALAEFFEQHPLISKVCYPGLPSHPQHSLAKSLFRHFGALMSIDVAPSIDCFAFLDALQLPLITSNLGDNRTLAIPVAQTIFYEMGEERRRSMDISQATIRLSIGIEDIDDLINDFSQALEKVKPA